MNINKTIIGLLIGFVCIGAFSISFAGDLTDKMNDMQQKTALIVDANDKGYDTDLKSFQIEFKKVLNDLTDKFMSDGMSFEDAYNKAHMILNDKLM